MKTVMSISEKEERLFRKLERNARSYLVAFDNMKACVPRIGIASHLDVERAMKALKISAEKLELLRGALRELEELESESKPGGSEGGGASLGYIAFRAAFADQNFDAMWSGREGRTRGMWEDAAQAVRAAVLWPLTEEELRAVELDTAIHRDTIRLITNMVDELRRGGK